MTTAELLIECKKGMGMQVDSDAFDNLLTPKVLAVTSFMKRAGVSEEMMADDLSVATIVMGVSDLWNLKGGEIKFSPVFYTFVSQLSSGGSVLTVVSDPLEGAVGVSVAVQPVLTFNKRIAVYSSKVSVVNYVTKDPVSSTVDLDITGKILTVEPSSLDVATKYAIVLDGVAAVAGPKLPYTVISFTTS